MTRISVSAGEVRPINLMLAETILTRLKAAGYVFNVPEEKDFAGAILPDVLLQLATTRLIPMNRDSVLSLHCHPATL